MFKKALVAVTLCLPLVTGPAHSAVVNLLTNGSFESDLTGWALGGTQSSFVPRVVTYGNPACCYGEVVPASTIVGGSPDPAGTHGFDVAEKGHAVQHDFKALVEDVAGAGEDSLKRLIGEEDAVVGVDDKDGLLQAAKRGFELRQLAGANLVQMCDLGDEFVSRRTEERPFVVGFFAGFFLIKQRPL